MRKFGPAKDEEEAWPFSPQHNLNILQNILLRSLKPSPAHSIGGQFLEIKVLRCSLSSTSILNTLRLVTIITIMIIITIAISTTTTTTIVIMMMMMMMIK